MGKKYIPAAAAKFGTVIIAGSLAVHQEKKVEKIFGAKFYFPRGDVYN